MQAGESYLDCHIHGDTLISRASALSPIKLLTKKSFLELTNPAYGNDKPGKSQSQKPSEKAIWPILGLGFSNGILENGEYALKNGDMVERR